MYTDEDIEGMARQAEEMEARDRAAMTPEQLAAYDAYNEEQIRRQKEGREYPIDEMLECWECGRAAPLNAKQDDMGNLYVPRKCVALGPITEARRDPTQTYVLECGHVVI